VHRGWYEAEAAGLRWRIVQMSGTSWEVLRNDPPFASYHVDAEWPHTLAEAKLHVADEVRALLDPEYANRREARRRAQRRAVRS
jgi:hypothetical protein